MQPAAWVLLRRPCGERGQGMAGHRGGGLGGIRCRGLTWEMMSLKEDLNSWTSAVSRFTSCPVRLAS